MYHRLKPDVSLRIVNNVVTLCRRGTAVQLAVSRISGLVLRFFSGTTADEEIAQLLVPVLSQELPAARALVDGVAWRYTQFLLAGAEPWPSAADADWPEPVAILEAREPEVAWRSAAPGALDWVVTMQCNRRCVYCYRDAPFVDKVTDSALSTADMRRLLDEAADIGVRDMIINGGEPFFRPDTVEIADYAQEKGIYVKAFTKFYFTPEAARALCRHGNPQVCISVDSTDEAVNRFLTGAADHFAHSIESIRNLMDAGATVIVSPVVTRQTLAGLPELIRRLSDLGVPAIWVSSFSQGMRHWRDDLSLLPEQQAELAAILEEHRELLGGGPDVRKLHTDPHPQERLPVRPKPRGCAGGLNSLTINPNGDATVCDKFVDERLVVGNVRRQSLMEIWHSPRMYEVLQAGEEHYAGTACAGCRMFTSCQKRGRCYYATLLATGEIYGPDTHCPRGLLSGGTACPL